MQTGNILCISIVILIFLVTLGSDTYTISALMGADEDSYVVNAKLIFKQKLVIFLIKHVIIKIILLRLSTIQLA